MLYNEQLVLSGELDDVGNPIRTNSGESYRIGLELEAVIPLGSKWALQPNLTLSTNRNRETITSIDGELVNLGSTAIAFTPNVIGANAIVYSPIEPLQISLLSKYVGEQFMSNTEAQLSKLDAYFINDLNVVYTIKTNKVFDSVVLTGLVNNLFNEKYVSNGYYFTFDDDFTDPGTITTVEGVGYYPQATINFLVGVSLFF